MLCVGHHLREAADLSVCAEFLFAWDQLDRACGELTLQFLDDCQRRIVWITDSEDNFVIWIILNAVRAEAQIHLWISALQRFQDRNWRESVGGRGNALTPRCKSKTCREAKHAIPDAFHGSNGRNPH